MKSEQNSAQAQTFKPAVTLLTTGGTIAGAGQNATSSRYKPAAQTGQTLLDSVPQLDALAHVQVRDVLAKDSSDLEVADWWTLHEAIIPVLKDPAISAVVITHGTDTLEETAYFLSLMLTTDKPVVLVGAMRAATMLSPDGPLNLLNAIAVAVDQESRGRGVLVVMNDQIFEARRVMKAHATAVQAFMSSAGGSLGSVFLGRVHYERAPATRALGEFRPSGVSSQGARALPRVEVLYLHAAMSKPSPETLQAWVSGTHDDPEDRLRGVVLAGMGAGNLPSYWRETVQYLRDQKVVVVRATRVAFGGVVEDYQGFESQWETVGAGALNPHKARILLMLALLETSDRQIIQGYFDAA